MLSARPYFFSYHLVYTSIRQHAFYHSARMACWRRHLFAITLTHASHSHPVRHTADESCAGFDFAGPLALPPPYARRNPATPPCLLVCLWAAIARRGSESSTHRLREQVHGLCGEIFSDVGSQSPTPNTLDRYMMMLPFNCSYRNKNEPTAIYPSLATFCPRPTMWCPPVDASP